jgi:L-serine dehydratase
MISSFDLYSVGIGPSASHTVGPMRAAGQFAVLLTASEGFEGVTRVQVQLLGSLAATGPGHGTINAVLLGLEGADPATVDPQSVPLRAASIAAHGQLSLAGRRAIGFDPAADVVRRADLIPEGHPNTMILSAYTVAGELLEERTYYSVGGGFVQEADEHAIATATNVAPAPFDFTTAAELLAMCDQEGVRVSDIMLSNETTWRSPARVRNGLLARWSVMRGCIESGCTSTGVLPGGLNVPRRAPELYARLNEDVEAGRNDPLAAIDWVNLYALAVNEENAAGGRVVTAPTNGAAGIIPAVIGYYLQFVPDANDDGVVRFLLTAAAVANLIKRNASISGAEVGCQGEVGSACAMAAAGLCEVLGGTPEQVENAAEIGIEHNLGLTCDPVGGLVQIPCIERNAIGAVKALNAARLALGGSGVHRVSLDEAIATMRQTGRDMHHHYKETSEAGLAVNVVEC